MTQIDTKIRDKLSSLKEGITQSSFLNSLKNKEKIDKLLVVMLDCSYSMGDKMDDNSKIDTAWKVFQDKLEPNLNGWKYGILCFGNDTNWFIFPTESPTLTNNIGPSLCGATSLGLGLRTAWSYIKENAVGSRIILLTDGEPTDMPKSQIVVMAENNCSIPIDTVAIGEGTNYDPAFLRQLSKVTGGIFCEATTVNKLLDIITKLSPINRPLLGVVR